MTNGAAGNGHGSNPQGSTRNIVVPRPNEVARYGNSQQPWAPKPEMLSWKDKTYDELEMEALRFEAMTQDISREVAGFKEVEWVVDGLIPKGSLILVGGAPKVARKSLLMMGLTIGIASGRVDVLDRKTLHGPCIYANLEDGRPRSRARLYDYGVRTGDLGIRRDKEMTLVTNVRALRDVQGYIRMRKPRVAAIDPLIELGLLQGITDENDAHQMSAMLRPWRELAHVSGTTIMVVHHFRKGGDTMRGSSVLEGACDGWWEIRYVAEDEPRVLQFTLRDADPGEVDIEVGYQGPHISLNTVGEYRKYHTSPRKLKNRKRLATDTSEERDTTVIARIRKCLVEQPDVIWSQKKLREEIGCKQNTLIAMINILKDDGNIVSRKGGGYVWLKDDPATDSIVIEDE